MQGNDAGASMRRTGVVWDERFLAHDTGPGHPERADRLRAILDALSLSDFHEPIVRIPGRHAEIDQLEAIHAPDYVERVRAACESGQGYVDVRETTVCAASWEAALLAAGGCVDAVDRIVSGELDNAFCPVRPPGHHAERDRALGFCLFNNVAVAAEHLRRRHRLRRVLILDWDVHHGNGTQHAFDQDPDVFFCSIHEDPRYRFPGTGWAHEKGQGKGLGTVLNLPLLPHAGDSDLIAVYEQFFVPAAKAFAPEFILVSVGFDAHVDDPLATLDFTDEGFDWLSRRTLGLADELCGGRLVSVLEGGYNLETLASCARRHVQVLLQAGECPPIHQAAIPDSELISEIRQAAARADKDVIFWW